MFGTMVRPGVVEDIMKSLLCFLRYPESFSLITSAGQDYVTREFSIEKMTESYCDCYEDVLVKGDS